MLILAVLLLGVYYRSHFFSAQYIVSNIPVADSIVFNAKQHVKTNSHTVHDIRPHEIAVSPPPKKHYSQRYLVVFLGKKILGAIEGKKYALAYYNINLPIDTSKGKSVKGDKLVPLGDYYVLKHELRGNAMFLVLNYPNIKDAERGLKAGIISQEQYDQIVNASKQGILPPFNTTLGGPVFIRGDGAPGMHTSGNIGIPPEAMRKVWEFAKKGTPVRIVP